jgi:hypothetical protein
VHSQKNGPLASFSLFDHPARLMSRVLLADLSAERPNSICPARSLAFFAVAEDFEAVRPGARGVPFFPLRVGRALSQDRICNDFTTVLLVSALLGERRCFGSEIMPNELKTDVTKVTVNDVMGRLERQLNAQPLSPNGLRPDEKVVLAFLRAIGS